MSGIVKGELIMKDDWGSKNIRNFGIDLSFSNVREFKRTKHIHRLHLGLGKFILQLVEIFLRKYFKGNEWMPFPLVGSGTTLIETNVSGINSIGVELLILFGEVGKELYTEVESKIKDIARAKGEIKMRELNFYDKKYVILVISDKTKKIFFIKAQHKNIKKYSYITNLNCISSAFDTVAENSIFLETRWILPKKKINSFVKKSVNLLKNKEFSDYLEKQLNIDGKCDGWENKI